MIGITADFPVREAPLMTVTFPGSNERRLGANALFLGQRMISLIWNNTSEPHFQSGAYFVHSQQTAPPAELLSIFHHSPHIRWDTRCSFGLRQRNQVCRIKVQ